MTPDRAEAPIRRVVGVSLNAAIDRTVSVARLEPGRIHRPVALAMVAGGKAANTVRAARHLGLPGSLVAVLGGHAGSWYRDALSAAGIRVHDADVPSETRTCLSVLDDSSGMLTEFYESGVRLRGGDWARVEAALGEALEEDPAGSVVVLAGSLPPGAPVDAYTRLASLVATAGSRAVVDVGGDALAAALGAAPWLVKVNLEEAASVASVAGGDPAGTARAIVDRGAGTTIVTLGIDGAVCVGMAGAWRLGPLPPEALGPYAVGSGDAFTAGWLVALAAGADAATALQTAGAAGAANARRPGQGEIDPSDVAAILPSLRVERIGG